MEFCDLKNPPEYTMEIERWTKKTKDNGEEMAVPIEQLLNNTYYNKSQNERLKQVVVVILIADNWMGSSAPYVQTVPVAGMSADASPLLVRMLEDGATVECQKAYNKAFGILAEGTGITRDGEVTFKVYKRPATDITVGLKGV